MYAYANALPQLELILGLMMEAGDALLPAPEFDAAAEQFCAGHRLNAPFRAMMESNYDAPAQRGAGCAPAPQHRDYTAANITPERLEALNGTRPCPTETESIQIKERRI